MMLTMKTQIDSKRSSESAEKKDLAILYKRFSFNSQDIIGHLTLDFTSSPRRKNSIDFLKR